MKKKPIDLCIVGGAGHVGLPLGIVFASKGLRVVCYDLNERVLESVRKGRMPFIEHGSEPLLKKVLKSGKLTFTSSPESIGDASTIIVTIGTPVDEFMNPDTKVMKKCMDELLPYLDEDQLVILRSTVYPGTTDWLHRHLAKKKKSLHIAFCPERIVQGYAIQELEKLPQIVSGSSPEAEARAAKFFRIIAPEVVHLKPMEAEFAKLFSNAYRYAQFAITNQFYMIANSAGLDYGRILDGMKKNYSRAASIPSAGFAAGPCLLKDTMQLVAFSDNRFNLGQAAMTTNEGLILYIVGQISKKYDLSKMTVGLLGMSFKSACDDTRASLSYKLKKVLQFRSKDVICCDPYVTTDSDLKPLKEVLKKSDILILCVPHPEFAELKTSKPMVDIWGFTGHGTRV